MIPTPEELKTPPRLVTVCQSSTNGVRILQPSSTIDNSDKSTRRSHQRSSDFLHHIRSTPAERINGEPFLPIPEPDFKLFGHDSQKHLLSSPLVTSCFNTQSSEFKFERECSDEPLRNDSFSILFRNRDDYTKTFETRHTEPEYEFKQVGKIHI